MKGALKIGKIAGIQVFIHWTFSLLLLFIIYTNYKAGQNTNQIIWSLIFILSIFVTVFLHELGHALAAKRFNVNTIDITILPIGGLARLERIPENPKEELIVAIAGPLVNLGISLITFFFISIPDNDAIENMLLGGIDASNFLIHFFIVNIWLAIFNIIPAFPMDGGRILRASLSFFIQKVKATKIAARIGQLFALGFIILGLYSNPFLILIGVFIMLGAQSELTMVATSFTLKGNSLREITMKNYETLTTDDTLEIAINKLLNGTSKLFLVVENQNPVGTLSRENMLKSLSEDGKDITIGKIMNTDLLVFNANESIEIVYRTMKEKNQEMALVKENNQIIGVVDNENILEFIMIKTALDKA